MIADSKNNGNSNKEKQGGSNHNSQNPQEPALDGTSDGIADSKNNGNSNKDKQGRYNGNGQQPEEPASIVDGISDGISDSKNNSNKNNDKEGGSNGKGKAETGDSASTTDTANGKGSQPSSQPNDPVDDSSAGEQTYTYNSGVFKVTDPDGKVSITFLYDGGFYKGQVAIVNAKGLESYVPGSPKFTKEVARRALTGLPEEGQIIISDPDEAALFSGSLGELGNWNGGEYLGVKEFQVEPGGEFFIMLVPNGTIEEIAKNPRNISDDKQPLYSITSANPNEALHFGQIADVTGDGHTFTMEDLRVDRGSDRDYNDLIFQVQGAIARTANLDEVIDPNFDWRTQTEVGRALVEYVNFTVNLTNGYLDEEEINARLSSAQQAAINQAENLNVYNPETLAATTDWVVWLPPNLDDPESLATLVGAEYIGSDNPIDNTHVWQFPEDISAEEIQTKLEDLSGSEFAYPLAPITLYAPSYIPETSTLDTPWHLQSTNETQVGTNVDSISDATGEGVTIAIVDDGVDWQHQALTGSYIGGYDFNGDTDSGDSSEPATGTDLEESWFYGGGSYSYWRWATDQTSEDAEQYQHGTAVAGVIVANSLLVEETGSTNEGSTGTVSGDSTGDSENLLLPGSTDADGSAEGVAPGAQFVSLRLTADKVTEQQIADALSWDNKDIQEHIGVDLDVDIYNNSWKPGDDLVSIGPILKAIEDSVDYGRDGLGSIFVFAAGNDGWARSNVNHNPFANSRFTIAVGAVDDQGEQSWYSEPGAPLVVSAPSSSSYKDDQEEELLEIGITTTDLAGESGYDTVGSYTNTFGGTSAAAAIVSGVVALMLEVNPDLTWRDVQQILLQTAQQNDLDDEDWVVNGAGYEVNHKYGFGVVDAAEAVSVAQDWQTMPPLAPTVSGYAFVGEELTDYNMEGFLTTEITGIINKGPDSFTQADADRILEVKADVPGVPVESTITISEERTVEWVEVVFESDYSYRGDLTIALISPQGTESVLTEWNPNDGEKKDTWTYTSIRHWGESSSGDWTLRVADEWDNEIGVWDSWTLNIYGTNQSTVSLQPLADTKVTEDGDATAFVASRLGGNINAPLTVNYAIGGLATNGTDYEYLPGTVEFVPGESEAIIPIVPIYDLNGGEIENVSINLEDADTYLVNPNQRYGTVNIQDSTVDASYGPFSYVNPNNGYIYRLTQQDTWLGARAQAEVLGGNLVAIDGHDESDWLLETFGDSQKLDGTTLGYGIIEINPYEIDPNSTDPSNPTFIAKKAIANIVTTDAAADETGNAGQFVISRVGSLAQDLTVNYTVEGSATGGADYRELPGTIVIPAGEAQVMIPILPVLDDLTEGENVIVKLAKGENYDIGTQPIAEVAIADPDPLWTPAPFEVNWYKPINLIADSVDDFSDTQDAQNGGWQYGYYEGNVNNYAADISKNFQELTHNGTEWILNGEDLDNSPYSTSLTANGGIPDGEVVTEDSQLEHLAIRRWTSKVEDTISISGNLGKVDTTGGNDIIGRILIDGAEVWSSEIAFDDTTGVNYGFDAKVSVGSVVDFIIESNSSDELLDESQFTATITQGSSIADSVLDFSDTQNDPNGWQYGYYVGDISTYPDNYAYDPSSTKDTEVFKLLTYKNDTNEWIVDAPDLANPEHSTSLTANGGTPDADVVVPSEHLAIRRWTSEVGGKISISGDLPKIDASGNGAIASILINGDEVFSQEDIPASQQTYDIEVEVKEGYFVDFVLDFAGGTQPSAAVPFTATITQEEDKFRGYFVTEPDTWLGAQAQAEAFGGNLVAIAENEQKWLTDTFSGENWIGLTDSHLYGASEGNFQWVGEETDYFNWAVGEPANALLTPEGLDFVVKNVEWYDTSNDPSLYGGSLRRGIVEVTEEGTIALNLDQTLSYTEDVPLDLRDIVVADPFKRATVTLTLANPEAGQILAATASNRVSSDADGVWTYESTGDLEELNDLLANLQFVPAADFNEDAIVNVTVSGTGERTGTIELKAIAQDDPLTIVSNTVHLTGATQYNPYSEYQPLEITYEQLLADTEAKDIDGDEISFKIALVTSGILMKDGQDVALASEPIVLAKGESLQWFPTSNGEQLTAFEAYATDGTTELPIAVTADVAAPSATPIVTSIPIVAIDPAASNITIQEKGGETGQITLTRSGPFDAPLTVLYKVDSAHSSAIPGEDYEPLSGYVTFAANSDSATIDITAINDEEFVGDRAVQVSLKNMDGYQVEPTASSATVQVLEDELEFYVVTNTNDSGEGSLRAAIEWANQELGAEAKTIKFEIPVTDLSPDPVDEGIEYDPATGTFAIQLESALPAITRPVVIDGNSQRDYINELATELEQALIDQGLPVSGSPLETLVIPETPIVELNGSNAGDGVNGLTIFGSGGSTVKGLTISSFGGNGILVHSSNNIIDSNAISGNALNGLKIEGRNSSGNQIGGNRIGTNASGTQSIVEIQDGEDVLRIDYGNGKDGLRIEDGHNNVIGSNLISGNKLNGITVFGQLGDTAKGNQIVGNYIGTDISGTQAVGNHEEGIEIDNAPQTIIGGTTSGSRNIISGNDRNGIEIKGEWAKDNQVLGNHIGTDYTGTAALGNIFDGVKILNAANNKIGGTTPEARNLISGNKNNGIEINGANFNQIVNNHIGTDISGTVALGNVYEGIKIIGNSFQNAIGLTPDANAADAELYRNLISGNKRQGILLVDGAGQNRVAGNYVGTDPTGQLDLGNRLAGIAIENAAENQIGGTEAGAFNLISGNDGQGIEIKGNDARANKVEGNLSGTNLEGTAALGNSEAGIEIDDAPANAIGGTVEGSGNLIAANNGEGIAIKNPGAAANQVLGNKIGSDISGLVALGNGLQGIKIYRAPNNIVGGTSEEAANLISANGREGVLLSGSEATGNQIQGNSIGTDLAASLNLGNGWEGVKSVSEASNNQIGGTDPGAGNAIAFNGYAFGADGVFLADGSGNAILGNEIFANAVAGIDLAHNFGSANDNLDGDDGPNGLQNFPVLTYAKASGIGTTVRGFLNSSANSSFRVELFSDSNGNQAENFLDFEQLVTDDFGNVAFETFMPEILSGKVTATATDSGNNTSELSQALEVIPNVAPTLAAIDPLTGEILEEGLLLSPDTVTVNPITRDVVTGDLLISADYLTDAVKAEDEEGDPISFVISPVSGTLVQNQDPVVGQTPLSTGAQLIWTPPETVSKANGTVEALQLQAFDGEKYSVPVAVSFESDLLTPPNQTVL